MKKNSKNDDISSDEEEMMSDNENNETDTINELLNEEKNTEDITNDDIEDIEQNDEDIDDKIFENEDSIMYDDDDDDDDNDIFTDIEPEKFININKRIPDNERSTRPILTKYEKVRLLGTRTKQISDGSKIFIKSKDVRSAIDIANLELKHKIIPLKIKRYLPNGKYEIWSVKELEVR